MRAPRRAVLAVAAFALCVALLASARSSPAEALGRNPPQQNGDKCTRVLVVPATSGAEGCWIDEHVTRNPGTLVVPCDGRDGFAEAVFGDRHFVGQMTHGALHLVLHTRFHFSDGCDWGTEQTIDGDPRGAHLAYAYREFPQPGQHGCASACRASGDVQVQ